MALDMDYSKKYNISDNIIVKYRIDKKIVVVKNDGTAIVLDKVSTKLMMLFNGGNSLRMLFQLDSIKEAVLNSFKNLIINNFLIETTSEKKLELIPSWTLDEVFFELSKNCNLKCHHCYIPTDVCENEMSLDEWKKIVDSCMEMGVSLIKITGGEPMMYKHFWNVISYLSEKPVRIRLYTNGSFLTEENIIALKSNYIHEIQISLDGGNKHTHDSFRRTKGNFDKIISALPILHKEKFNVILSFTQSDYNTNAIDEFIMIAKRYDNIKVVISPYINYHQTVENEKILSVNNDMINHLKKCFEENKMIWSDKTRYYLTYPNNIIGYCGVGIYSIYIDSTGKLMLCPLLNQKENIIGNIRDTTLNELWNHALPLTQYRKFVLSDIDGCNTCTNAIYCRGGCRARAYFDSGKLFYKDKISCMMY